jgi:hypothetical protein
LSRYEPFANRASRVGRRRTLEHAPRRSSERWVALLLLGCGLGVVGLLGVPRPVVPYDVPLPRVVRPLLLAEQRAEAERVRNGWRGLSRNVRTVGELVRRVGQAEATGDVESLTRLRGELLAAARTALANDGEQSMLDLRALQTELFLRALHDLAENAVTGPDALELGGTLCDRATKSGWVENRRLRVSDEPLRALYRLRWADLVGLGRDSAFGPSLNDWRLFYRHRFTEDEHRFTQRSRLEAQLDDIRALAHLDPSYPGDYAAGIVLYHLGAVDRALESFRAHLRAHPNGDWSLRARNYATACAAQLFEE